MLIKFKDMLGNLGWEHMWLTEHIVRKSAHFIEYAGLGYILVMAFRLWKEPVLFKLRNVCELVFIIPFVDETIQLFVPGRSGQMSDVWLDLCGAVCGMVLTGCIMAWLKQRRLKQRRLKQRRLKQRRLNQRLNNEPQEGQRPI